MKFFLSSNNKSKKKSVLIGAIVGCLLLHYHQLDAFVLVHNHPRLTTATGTTTTITTSTTTTTTRTTLNDRHIRNKRKSKNNIIMLQAMMNYDHQNLNKQNNHRRREGEGRQRKGGGRLLKNKYNNNNKNNNNQHLHWLTNATDTILRQPSGSIMEKGKWHEVVSMIKAWSKYAKSNPNVTPIMIERLIKKLIDEQQRKEEEEQEEAGAASVVVDIELYNILLDAWACKALFSKYTNNNSNNKKKKQQQQQEHNQQHDNGDYDDDTKNGPAMASQRAREILVLLQETFEETNTIQPNEQSFATVFHVVNRVEGPTIARRVLAWMEHLHSKEKNEYARPLEKHYIMLLDAYANSRDGNAGQLAEGFIRHMKVKEILPNTLCYNIAIKAWIKARRGRESAEHAQHILEEMDAPKDIITYSSVIAAWAGSGMRSHAVDRAEELLQEIYNSPHIQPNTVVLNTVMSTWVKSRNPKAVQRTKELLQYMEDVASSSSSSTTTTSNSSNKNNHKYDTYNRTTALSPDLISYNTHLHALSLHANKHPYAQQANDLLESLESRYDEGEISFRPNLFSYNLVIDAWSRSTDYDAAWNAVRVLRKLIETSDGTPQPDAFSFNQVFSALSKSSKPGAAALAEKLLGYMEDAYNMRLCSARPDVIGYTSVIVTLARSGEANAAERAERIFLQMKERYATGTSYMKPTRATFNALIDCWAKSGKGTFAARKAEALLKEMEEGDDTVSPNIVTYNAVLNCWAQSGTRCCGNQAEKYLDRMWELYDDGDGTIAPNEFSFNTVINAISKSQSQEKAQKALRLLRRMDKLYQSGYKDARPNEMTYTSVLNSCAFPATTCDPRMKRKALDTAIFTLQELRSSRYGHPNEVTYGTFMQACANLLVPTEDEILLREVIEQAFQQCCMDGQVGEMVLTHLKTAAPDDLYKELLAEVVAVDETTVNVENLPPEWRCNIRGEPRFKDEKSMKMAEKPNSKLLS